MTIAPLLRQFFVAGSTHLAALSAGGVVAYPNVLLRQFNSNESTIQLDLQYGSWIGSVHGFAGIPSIFLPLLMQYNGRKPAFILSCTCIIIGWIIIYTAQTISTLIIGECFHGLGTNSLLAVSFSTISEIVHPKYRNTCLLIYSTVQIYGMTSVSILGSFFHWKTLALIMGLPAVLALPIGCVWPESPSWFAYKGKLEECKRTFLLLRGTNEQSQRELEAMINFHKDSIRKSPKKEWTKHLYETITRKDFYKPTIHVFILINQLYWGGGMPVIIYSSNMMEKLIGKQMDTLKLIMDVSLVIGYNIAIVVVRYMSSKKFMLCGMCGSTICMTLTTIVAYLRSNSVIEKGSNWELLGVYSLVGYMAFSSLGSTSLGFSIASELMPVKHRGIGGSLYVIFTCICHSTSLKAYPYLCEYLNLWGILLIYTVYTTMSIVLIGKYVPETRNKNLHEIEHFYVHGYFQKVDKTYNVDESLVKSKIYK